MPRDLTPETVLEVRDLVKDFPRPAPGLRSFFLPAGRQDKVRALGGVTFSVRGSSVHGILGTNGAGKTTLLRIIMNLLLPTSGKVTVMGREVGRNDFAYRDRLGMSSGEERSFYWRLSGRKNLEFFASLQGMGTRESARRILELADLLGLREYLDVPFSDYSAGMRQRMSLARALLHDPDILLLDEPTRSLSPETARPLQDFILRHLVEEEGKTVLLATQDMREAERMCRELVLLDRGMVLYAGSLEELLREGRRKLGEGSHLEDIYIHKVTAARTASGSQGHPGGGG